MSRTKVPKSVKASTEASTKTKPDRNTVCLVQAAKLQLSKTKKVEGLLSKFVPPRTALSRSPRTDIRAIYCQGLYAEKVFVLFNDGSHTLTDYGIRDLSGAINGWNVYAETIALCLKECGQLTTAELEAFVDYQRAARQAQKYDADIQTMKDLAYIYRFDVVAKDSSLP